MDAGKNDCSQRGYVKMKISLLPISFYEAVEKDEMTVMDWVKFASRIKDLDAD